MGGSVGKMRERVAVYAQTQIVNAAGEITTTWDKSAGLIWSANNQVSWGEDRQFTWGTDNADFDAWARVEPVSASSLVLANRDDAQRLYNMTIRYRTDITTNSQVIWRGRKFDVEGIMDPTEQRQFLSVRLREINA